MRGLGPFGVAGTTATVRKCVSSACAKDQPVSLGAYASDGRPGQIKIAVPISLDICSDEHDPTEKAPVDETDNAPVGKPTRMRRKITHETCEQIKTAYAAGINLREIARKMNIPEGTVLAHAKRHGWTQQIQVASLCPNGQLNHPRE